MSGTKFDVDGIPEPTLYFDGPQEFAHMVSTTLDHFALSLVLLAMRSGQDLHLEGLLTDELLFQSKWTGPDLDPIDPPRLQEGSRLCGQGPRLSSRALRVSPRVSPPASTPTVS